MQGFKSSGLAAITFAALLATSSVAFGFDKTGNVLADALLENIEASGAKDISVGSVTGDSARTEITDISATVTENGETAKLSVGSLVFENGSVEDGQVKADKVVVKAMRVDGGPDVNISLAEGFADQVIMPKADDIRSNPNSFKAQAAYKHAELSNISFTTEDGDIIPVEAVVIDLDDFSDGRPHTGSASVTGITLKKDVLDAEAQQSLEQFGYDQITLALSSKGSWDEDAGIATVEQIKISGEQVGTLTITGKFGGLTKDVVEKLENNEKPEDAMAILQGINVHGLSIRIDNDSIVERALDAQAKEMGVDRDTFADQLAATAPMFLAALQNKEFEAQAAAAIGTFLKNRKSIMAVAQPAQPVAAAQIMGAVMIAPQTLPNVLAVQLSNP